ncbi:MAG: alpha/beta hydrolase, partial [Planctomycetota bacterium]|nr:alpha/beta hydrolase [Planctomycetota bacterium]
MVAVLSALVLALAPQEPIAVHEDLQYFEAAKLPRRNRLDLYVPAAAAPPALVMFVHGGSWTGGSKDRFAAVGRLLAAKGFACATINTRLFPFAKPREMVVDCARALGFLHRNAQQYGYDGDRLFLMGHSSGAHLCSWLAYDDRKFTLSGVPKQALRGAVLLSGPYDVRVKHMILDVVFGADRDRRLEASTWRYVDAGECPAYVAWAEREIPGVNLCGQLLRDELLRKGIPVRWDRYRNRSHANYIFQLGTARDCVTDRVVAFLEDPLGGERRDAALSPRAMLWVASDAAEQSLGEKVRAACASAGVDVVVQRFEAPDGARVTAAYRRLRAERAAAGRSPLRFAAGFGIGGGAVASSTLTSKTDGLAGRIVANVPLGPRSLRAVGRDRMTFEHLDQAPLLSICGGADD